MCFPNSDAILTNKIDMPRIDEENTLLWDSIPPVPGLPEATAVSEPTPLIAAPKAPTTKRRMYYLDWLRVYLTIMVICFHTAALLYSGWWPLNWNAPDWAPHIDLLKRLFTQFNQSYFMGLFFALAGYFCTPSFNRKGVLLYFKDRFLRLIVPLAIYESFFYPTLYLVASKGYHKSEKSPVELYRHFFTKYQFLTSHMWFVMLLFLFDVLYALVRLVIPPFNRFLKNKKPPKEDARKIRFSNWTMMLYMVGASVLLILLNFVIRIWFRPGKWVPALGQMAYLGQYLLAYSFGNFLNLVNGIERIPRAFGLVCILPALGSFAAYFVVDRLNPTNYDEYRLGASGLQLFYTSFEMIYSLCHSIFLLTFFREFLNITPNGLGKRIIGATYATYVFHPWAVVPLAMWLIPTNIDLIAKFFIECFLAVPYAWILGMLVKMIPYADRIF